VAPIGVGRDGVDAAVKIDGAPRRRWDFRAIGISHGWRGFGRGVHHLDQIDTLPRLISDARLRQPRDGEMNWCQRYLFLFVISF